jgi:Tol biopolymer transport system component
MTFLACVAGFLLAAPIPAQVTQRVSAGSGGVPGNGMSYVLSLSADGRCVAFASQASNLVPGDTNAVEDVFVADRLARTTERISVRSDGTEGNASSTQPWISADGRFVAFVSNATNLVSGDTNGFVDVFVHDRLQHTTERVSVSSTGGQTDDMSWPASISADGRFVSFWSHARNLVPGDTNFFQDSFVRDRQSGSTERVSVGSGGAQGNGGSEGSSLSADGRFVAFDSGADTLVPGDTNGDGDIFVRDRGNGTTELVSVNSAGIQGNGGSGYPWLSADGRFVAFVSSATNLDPLDTNADFDVFVRDLQAGVTQLASVSTAGAAGNGVSDQPSISSDGRRVQFESSATNLVPGDTNATYDVFVRDLADRTTKRVSVSSNGREANAFSYGIAISGNGRYAAFWSGATNLVPGDVEGWVDGFVHDLDATGFTSVCDPGSDGVIACPCANPPSGPGRGCENSSATGGAGLDASGIAYVSTDSLVFTTSGERPSALSILMQGNGVLSGGMVYGQGVRCVGGTIIRRLFIAQASGGSITTPDFGAGDPTVSARSAAKGDVIQAGQSRWYLVYYRDPVVLGGCPSNRTFNATQTGRVDWAL